MNDSISNLSPRIQFVCRGGVRVGLGHVMRTRAVATAAKDQSAQVEVVVIGDESLTRTLMGRDLPFVAVQNDWQAFERVQSFDAHIAVFDLLDFDEHLLRLVATQRRTAGISPVFSGMNELDAVYTRARLPAEIMQRLDKPKVYAGAQFATIGPHCRRIDDPSYERAARAKRLAVAISMGGADAANNTLRVLQSIRQVRAPLLIWALLGEGYTHSYQSLVDCVGRDRRHEIILAKTRDSMWRILSQCGVAILAGGITTFEAAYAGIPAIVALDRAQDRFLIDELIDRNAAICAGAPMSDATLTALTDQLERFDADRNQLLRMHRAGRQLLDENGAARIACGLIEQGLAASNRRAAACG